MAKTKTKSFLMTIEEEQVLNDYVKQQRMSTGENVTASSVIRDAVLSFIHNGQPDNKQEPTEKPAEQPTEKNPFADISLD